MWLTRRLAYRVGFRRFLESLSRREDGRRQEAVMQLDACLRLMLAILGLDSDQRAHDRMQLLRVEMKVVARMW